MTHFPAFGYRKIRRFLAIAALTGVAAHPASAQARRDQEDHSNRWLIMVNGDSLGYGRLVTNGRAELHVRVADLVRAVDGDARTSRLRVQGNVLMASSEGRCGQCRLRIVRPVMITRAVRQIEGEAYLPVRDLVRALEGRLVIDAVRNRYTIHAGKCDWCILEPSN